MNFAENLIHRIDNPEHQALQQLQQKAIENIEPMVYNSDVPDVTEDVIRKLSYIYYYDWVSDDPEYMWLVQDPDNFGKDHLKNLRENNPLANDCTPREQVSVYRQFGKDWLTGSQNENFSEKVFSTLYELELIDLEGTWTKYLNQDRFYRDIYLTDVIKYRTGEYDREDEQISYKEFLKEEIRELEPSLIFSFGKPALRTVRRNMDPSTVKSVGLPRSGVIENHGTLYSVEDPINTYVLVLAHMSPRNRGRLPLEEYMDRMITGIENWKELQ